MTASRSGGGHRRSWLCPINEESGAAGTAPGARWLPMAGWPPAVANGPPPRRNAPGLRVAWLQWRGPGTVKFDPWYMEGVDDHMPDWTPPALPPDGRGSTTARFSVPGTYVIRAMADDGSLFTPVDITVNVAGDAAATPQSKNQASG